MVLELLRRYFPDGTNGDLWCKGERICRTIELPWNDNERNVSCIPEGKYLIKSRFTDERGWHFEIANVPNRSFILFHPANDALKELRGCIAPVSSLTGPGCGLASRKANAILKSVIREAMETGEVYLTITSSD